MKVLLFFCIICLLPTFSVAQNMDDDRRTRVYGTGNAQTGGSVHTYTDPQTGDIVTSVVPPNNNETYSTSNNNQSFPIYVYPEITPSNPSRPPRPRDMEP